MLQSAVVLVLDDASRILAVDNLAHGGIGMPGGKREPFDPSITHTAVRELCEETNLVAQAEDLELMHAASWRFRRKDGTLGPERLAHLFYAKRVRGLARAMEGGTNLHRVSYADLIRQSPFGHYYRSALMGGRHLLALAPTEVMVTQ